MDTINIRKRYHIILVALIILCALFCCSAGAEGITVVASGTCGYKVTWKLDSAGTLTIEGEGRMNNYSYQYGQPTMPWNSVGDDIVSVIIKDGVTSIGSYAFYGCSSLTSITIPDSVSYIGEKAFYNSYELSDVYADSVEGWLGITFDIFYSAYGADASSNPMYYGDNLYFNGVLAENIAIPDGITSIGDAVFFRCDGLTSITIPDSVTFIGDLAFSYCDGLTSITIPDSVTFIGDSAFYDCDNLTSIILSDSITSIGDSAFFRCLSLTSITIPDSVTSIGKEAFYYCPSLTSITIPNSVSSIGEKAFKDCDSLTDVYAGSVEGWLGISFSTVDSNPMHYGENLYFDGRLVENITIPNSVTSIDQYAFKNCKRLTSITIPDSVTYIGQSAFISCTALSSVTIGNSVSSIGDYAFSNCSSLTSITIPNSVTSIRQSAFKNCSSLTNVTIGNSVSSIGEDAFYNCSSLTSITIPNSVTSISQSTFFNCSNLSSVTIGNSVTFIGNSAFYDCSSLTSINIPNSVTSIRQSAFKNCSRLTNVTIGNSVTSIGDYAFEDCDRLTSITIPDSVSTIGHYAFADGASKKSFVFFGEDMPTIKSSAFDYCTPTIYCYEYTDIDYWALDQGYKTIYLDNITLPLFLTLPADCTLAVGKTLILSAPIFPAQEDAVIEWTSSDPAVVSVDNGVLTALSVGEATITAACGDLSDSMVVTTFAAISSFEIPEEIWLVTKTTAQLSVQNILPIGATGAFTYTSSNTDTLTVNESGLLTGVRPGDATVTVTANSGVAHTCTLHVCYPVTAIELDPASAELIPGETMQLTATVTARSQSFVNKLVEFASSDEAIATVDGNGLITAVAPGTAAITVSAASGVSAQCAVTVQEAIPFTLPADLTSIEAEAFANIDAEMVIIPDGCLSIGSRAFADCTYLSMVVIPDSVTDIADDAFEGCKNVTFICASVNAAAVYANAHNIVYTVE